MANRVTRRRKAVLSGGLHPHYRETIETHARFAGVEIVGAGRREGSRGPDRPIDDTTSCVVVQNPDFFGHVRDLTPIAEAAHAAGALLVVVVTEVVSLGLLQPPGEMGADIVVAEGQSIGNALDFGGPYVGLFATRAEVRAPDAGPAVRRDGRCRGPARLRADARRRASSTSAARRRPATSAPIPGCARSPSRSI